MKNKDNATPKRWNSIYRYFKTTSEPYDELDFDGEELRIWLDSEVIERYSVEDLSGIICNLR